VELLGQVELIGREESVVALPDRLDTQECQAATHGVGGDAPAARQVSHGSEGFGVAHGEGLVVGLVVAANDGERKSWD